MAPLFRLAFFPIIVSGYTLFGAKVGYSKPGVGVIRGGLSGWAAGVFYTLTGQKLEEA